MAMTASPPRDPLSVSVGGLFDVAAWLALVGPWAGFLGHWWWPLDLAAHFQIFYVPCLIGALAWFGFRRRLLAAALAIVTLALVLARIAPVFIGEQPGAADASTAPRLRLLSLNVLTANRDKQRVLDFITREDADVVFLMEVDALWAAALAPLAARYPHHLVFAQEDNFGVAFFSRVEARDLKVIHLGEAGTPTVAATLRLAGRELRFFGTHPVPPISGQFFHWQRDQMTLVADHVRGQEAPVLLAGDLNSTPWGSVYRELARRTGLAARSVDATWQATWHALPFAGLPIDHVLCTREMQITARRVGPAAGSDHRPLTAEVAWRAR